MNWLDIVILVLLALSIFSGIKTGLISSLMGLVGVILGIVLAGRLYETVAGWLSFLPGQTAANVIAFILVFAAVVVGAVILGKILTVAAKTIMLGWLNALGGAAFGLLMGMISVGAVLAIWITFFGMSSAVSNSFLGSWLVASFPLVLGLLPPQFEIIKSFFT